MSKRLDWARPYSPTERIVLHLEEIIMKDVCNSNKFMPGVSVAERWKTALHAVKCLADKMQNIEDQSTAS